MTSIDPRYMTVTEWADRMNLLVDPICLPERLDDPEEWQDWATNLMDSCTNEGQNIPDPYAYDNWMDWAERFNQVVELPG